MAEDVSLYDELLAAGVPLDNHESDLYVKDTPEARAILAKHGKRAAPFVNQIDHTIWFDVPFMYEPFWRARVVPR